MNIPQTGRKPLPLSPDAVREMLRKRHREDRLDPFATDPDEHISELGKLAVRRKDVNDPFALGDMCALRSLTADNRLLIFYVGKTLLAYRRAAQSGQNDVDRKQARRAIDDYIQFLIEVARRFPTRRNIAVALWGIADEGDTLTGRVAEATIAALLNAYRRGRPDESPDAAAKPGSSSGDSSRASGDDDGTAADIRLDMLSDVSQTIIDVGLDENAISREASAVQPVSETRHYDSSVFMRSSLIEESEADHQRRPSSDSDPSVIETAPARTGDEFPIGARIETSYEVVDVRWGGMGVVYLCYDHDQRAPVAIKSFQSRFLENDRAVNRFVNEALTWIRLEKHRHIVQARLVRNINGRPHIILEHVSGPEMMGADLRSWIERRIDLPKALEFGLHISLGMQHATQRVPGLVHRDLKPANILVTHEGIAKVTDFGLVRSLDLTDIPLAEGESSDDESVNPNDRLTRVGAVVGTAPYMSPEQCQSLEVDMRSDIYAFGCLMYEMLTGRHVFRARKFPEWIKAHIGEQPLFDPRHVQRIPQKLQDLVLNCLAKDPVQRPRNWGDLVEHLSEIYQEVTGQSLELEIVGPALEVRELIDKGYSLTELSRFDEALEAYDQAIALKPDHAQAWARKGRTLRLLERYEDALICYNRALDIDPKFAWAWNGKGIIMERLGRLEQALECFDIARTLNPNDVWYWYNHADALQTLGRYEEAIPLLQHGIQLDAAHPNSWGKLGQIYRLQQRFEEAVQAYEHAIQLAPNYAWAHNGNGLALKALGRSRDALMCFKRAARYQPNEVWHWYNLTEMLVDLGQYHDAVQPAQEATRVDPTHAYSWSKLGQVMRYIGHNEEALKAYERAIELEPENAWSINGKGIVLEHLERYEEALVCYQRAAELKPNDIWHWYNQGNVLVLMGRYEDAITPLQHATHISRQHSRAWARMAFALRSLGRHDESLQAAQQATRTATTHAWAWHEYGCTLEAMNRYDEALSAYEHAAELSSGEPFYIYKQTDMLVNLGQNQRAYELLERALRLDGANPQTWAKLGQVLRRLNHLDKALEAY